MMRSKLIEVLGIYGRPVVLKRGEMEVFTLDDRAICALDNTCSESEFLLISEDKCDTDYERHVAANFGDAYRLIAPRVQ